MRFVTLAVASVTLMPLRALSDSRVTGAQDAFCREAGAGNEGIPGNVAACADVVRAREEDGECVGDSHHGDSEVHCNMAIQLAEVRRTMQAVSAQTSRHEVLNSVCRDTTNGCTLATNYPGTGWTCFNPTEGSVCDSGVGLLAAVWALEYATRAPPPMPLPVPHCTPPQVRYFNRGECTDECPQFQERVEIGGEPVCLPMVTREADRLEESTLEAVNEGYSDIVLRLWVPLLPRQFAENVSTHFVVDMKQNSSGLRRSMERSMEPLAANSCDLQWHRMTADAFTWRRYVPGSAPQTVGAYQNHDFAAVGNQVDGLHFAPGSITWSPEAGELPPLTTTRVEFTAIFPGNVSGTNSQDSLSFSVNGRKQPVYWSSLGRSKDDDEGHEIYRTHVCEKGTEVMVQEDLPAHCKHHFYFDAMSDENGNLLLELASNRGAGNTEDFPWLFANFKVETPYIEATFSYNDFDGACELKPGLTVGQHIERRGIVGVGLVGTWAQPDGTAWQQLLMRAEFPLTAKFSSLVTASFLPFNVWETHLGEGVNATGPVFSGKLEMFEEGYVYERVVPRYEWNTTVYARHCLEDQTLSFELDWRGLYMSDALKSAPESSSHFEPEYNLTDSVTILRREGTCVDLSFTANFHCDWCFLHSYAVAMPVSRLLGRRLSQAPGFEMDEVESRAQAIPGMSINTANQRYQFAAEPQDVQPPTAQPPMAQPPTEQPPTVQVFLAPAPVPDTPPISGSRRCAGSVLVPLSVALSVWMLM